MIEALPEPRHLRVQFGFTGMREGRMADVMHERQSFGQVFVQLEYIGDGSRDLRDFDGVCLASSRRNARACTMR